MQLYQPARTLAEHNDLNRADLLQQLTIAYEDAPDSEPAACRLLRQHCAGLGRHVVFNYETAHNVQPNTPVKFAEALFIMRDEDGNPLKSIDVLRTLQTHRKDLRLDSRFRFWLGFAAAETFFNVTDAFTHLSINIPAYAAASPYFTERFEHGARMLAQDHPGKGLIIEMLEQQPWNDAQRRCMAALKARGVGFAVDDYGAFDGFHTPRSLQLAAEYSAPQPPLVKIDGGLTTACLKSGDFKPLTDRLAEVQTHTPGALLVFEWVQNAREVAHITCKMQQAGVTMPISYVQGHGFDAAEQKKILSRLTP